VILRTLLGTQRAELGLAVLIGERH
jgi:hypothetical protein